MRTALTVLTDELRRLKVAGVRHVSVSDSSLAALRRAAASRRAPESAPQESPGEAGGPAVPGVSTDGNPARPASPVPPVSAPAAAMVKLPAGDKAARWKALKGLVQDDPVCQAHVRPGKHIVLGVGNLDARIFFVGEAPGAEEEVQAEPFVGPAGQLLNKMIAGMGLARADVYIGNIMNWRPELPVGPNGQQYGNRPPTPAEMVYCLPYLRAQIEVVDPAILVALGSTAAQGLLGPGTFRALGEVRGTWREFAGKPLMITYHPSYILRNPTNRSKRLIWEDLLKVMARAEMPISDKQQGYFLEK